MADAAGWHRFKQVTQNVPTGHSLYRASAPNYDENVGDKSQNLTQAAVDFLVKTGIDSIISYNEYEYTSTEKDRLAKAKPVIKYLHLKLGDFKPPTLAQLKQADDFFLQNKSTIVHCGYGHGRTGTGITGLQIYTVNGKTLQPLASIWRKALDSGGNNVETQDQVSILAEQRNLFLPRLTGTPAGDGKAYAVINFGTGYYLALSSDKKSVTSISAETAETASSIQQAYQWTITKDNQGNYTLTNKTSTSNYALTKTSPVANDPVTYGASSQGNTLFTIKEVASGDKGRYVVSPKPASTLAVVINSSGGVLLATKNESNKLGLWILLKGDF